MRYLQKIYKTFDLNQSSNYFIYFRNPQHQLMVGLTVKLNAKKFPVDFFSRNDTPTGRIRALYSERILGSKNEERKQ